MKIASLLLVIALTISSIYAHGVETSSSITKKSISKPVAVQVPVTPGVIVHIDCPLNSPCSIVRNTTKQMLEAVSENSSVAKNQNLVATQFNFDLMTRYALGNNWKLANGTQQGQLVKLFQQLLIYTYSSAIAKFDGAQITIISSTIKNKTAAVKSQVILPNANNNQPVAVEYDLAKITATSSWKAYDIKIENVSLVTTYRNQFNEVIQSNQVEGLIKQLTAKIAKLQSAKSN
jgi:phospholipid transport system substrate-binding protein